MTVSDPHGRGAAVAGNVAFVPEPRWLFRRILTFAVILYVGIMVGFIAYVLAAAGATAALLTLALALIIQSTILQLIYLIAPSAEYVQAIAKVVDAAQGGIDRTEPPRQ